MNENLCNAMMALCLLATACSGPPSDAEAAELGAPARGAQSATPSPRPDAPAPPAAIPRDYLLVPGGYMHSSCVHSIPNGAAVKGADVFDAGGTLVAHHERCAYPSMLRGVRGLARPAGEDGPATATVPGPTTSTWKDWASQDLPPGATTWNYYAADITVPPYPSVNEGQTLYYFGGAVSGDGGAIVQPVLQWTSSWFGPSWSFASYLVTFGVSLSSPATHANVGDRLHLSMGLVTGGIGNRQWVVRVEDLTTGQTSSASFDEFALGFAGAPLLYPRMYPAVLEEWNANSCGDTVRATFSNILLASDQNQSSVISRIFQWQDFHAETSPTGSPSCFYVTSMTNGGYYGAVTIDPVN